MRRSVAAFSRLVDKMQIDVMDCKVYTIMLPFSAHRHELTVVAANVDGGCHLNYLIMPNVFSCHPTLHYR